jgi:hypothetical protein
VVCDLLSVQDFGCRCHGTRRRQRAGCDVTAIRSRSVAPLGAIVITAFVLLLTPNTPELPQVPGVYDAEVLDDLTDSVRAKAQAVAVRAAATIVSFATLVPLSASSPGFTLVGTRQGPAVGLRAPPAS